MTIGNAVYWIKQKEVKHFLKASTFALVGGLIGIMANAIMLFTTYDYSKATIRGGQASLKVSDTLQQKKTTGGLDTAYAFLYGSYGIAESFTIMVPGIYGGSAGPLGEDSKLVETMQEKGIPQQMANQLYSYFPGYWGQQPGHAGPVYLGAIFCLLFIFGMFFLKTHHKWWILGITIFALMMSWGKNFGVFNNLMFEYLPFYNKFRAPAIIMVIPQLMFPLVAVLSLQELLFGNRTKEDKWKALRLSGIVTAGLFLVLGFLYISFDYRIGYEKEIQQQLTQMAQGDASLGKDIINAVVEDRKGMFGKDLLRSLFFIGAAWLLLFFFSRNKIKAQPVIWALIVLSLIDLLGISSRYLNKDNYLEPEDFDGAFLPTPADIQIKQDPEQNYRVFNLTQSSFNDAITSYHHKSIGGYHAAKLSIYQDLIENQLSKQPMNMGVINMLNTKYIITQDSTGRVYPQQNPGALGSAWLVGEVKYVPDARAEMSTLNDFNPSTTAIVQESFKKDIPAGMKWDTAAFIKLVKNENDVVTYQYNASSPQFAVFSEVYYDRGWKAYIDEKESPIIKTNYVLRGLYVPAGNHNIVFRFKPNSYTTGKNVTLISQLLLLILLIAGLWFESRKKEETEKKA
jgi:hypothetical protein